MFSLRISPGFSSLTRRVALSARPFTATNFRFAQGYSDGEGDPKGENPQSQGGSNHTKHTVEHPGREPPSESKGTGGNTTKAGSGNNTTEEGSSQSGGGGGGGEGGGGEGGKAGTSPRPRIHDHSTPSADTAEKKAEVEQHNKEFDQGHDRAPRAAEDKVDKKFWSGQGGADSQS